VISYDYTGYGRSDGSASEEELYTDIEEVVDFMTNNLRLSLDRVVL
jgi:hypothetical protein